MINLFPHSEFTQVNWGVGIFSFHQIYLVHFSIVSKGLCEILRFSFHFEEIVLLAGDRNGYPAT